jgi:polyketide synthase-like dehydratase family protein
VTVPALLELCLQASGLWDLATSGRMMIPAGVDQVVTNVALNYRPADASLPIEARVRPRAPAAGPTAFDGEVADGSGRILLVMRGYRTADLGAAVGADHVGRIRRVFDQAPATAAGRR